MPERLIGRPYKLHGRGPDAFDCWGLVCYVWREHYGIDRVPEVAVSSDKPLAVRRRLASAVSDGEAVELTVPVDGCAVYMSRARLPDHIGIYLAKGDGVLHALERSGVVFSRIASLPFIGFNVIGYYGLYPRPQ